MNSFKKYLLILRVMHVALIIGLLLFLAIATLAKGMQQPTASNSLSLIFQLLVPLLLIACITAAQMMFKGKLYKLDQTHSLDDKLETYKTAFIIKCALIEVPATISTVALLLTGDRLFALIAAFVIAYLIMQYPSKQKLVDSLPLTKPEIDLLNQNL